MPKRWRIFSNLIVCVVLLSVLVSSVAPFTVAQETTPSVSSDVEAIFEQLSPAQRVGQLFIVTFQGESVTDNGLITSLISDYHIGGVWLRPSNKPSTASVTSSETSSREETLSTLQTLINQLQATTYQSSVPITSTTTTTDENVDEDVDVNETTFVSPTLALTESVSNSLTSSTIQNVPIPLFIGVDHEGNGYPHTFLAPELTNIPSNMALGATWNPDYATQVGTIAGQELSALGINMLFGPMLDVVDKPRLEPVGVAGVRAFGGDPYWVGKMGRAYIKGVHQGSEGQVLTIAKHFPGAGSIDRQLNQDVPTIQKSLVQLEQIELAPFYAVTAVNSNNADLAEDITDGLMTAHIRYRGLQGNIRELTQPISLDAQRLPIILSSPEIAPWRNQGGLIISGPLGTEAIAKTYQVNGEAFPARRIALDAFLAGNDILLLSEFGSTDEATQYQYITTAINFFQDRYETDTAFQQDVDISVKRILQAKLKLYDDFSIETILKTPDTLTQLTDNSSSLTPIIRDSATLIYPDSVQLGDRIPSPPLRDEKIVIFTDARRAQLCVECEPFYQLDPTALEQVMLNRYGPDASDQIGADQISSFTFVSLADTLVDNPQARALNEEINATIDEAEWIIFAMLDVNESAYPASGAVKQFLRERSLGLRDKKVIVFSFDAPYYLDNTEASILTAYYSLYNKTQKHLETAVSLLFREFEAQGQSPVSIDATAYDLILALEPDPEQVITLEYFQESTQPPIDEDIPATATSESVSEGTPPVVTVPPTQLGDRLVVRTGVIEDHNGNPVPDNTLVAFNQTYPSESLELAPIIVPTIDGIAKTIISIDREGLLEITVESGEATRSGKIIIEGPIITIETPTPTNTATPTATDTPTVTPTNTPSATPTFTNTPTPEPTNTPQPAPQPRLPVLASTDLIFSLMMLVGLGIIIFIVMMPVKIPLETRLSPILIVFTAGLIGYVLYGIFAAQLAEFETWHGLIKFNTEIHWLPPAISFVFALTALGGHLLIRFIRQAYQNTKDKEEEEEANSG